MKFPYILVVVIMSMSLFCSYHLSAGNQNDGSAKEEQKIATKTIFEKYLPTGDCVRITQKTSFDDEQQEVNEYEVYLKRLNVDKEQVVWSAVKTVPKPFELTAQRFRCTPYDIYTDEGNLYFLFAVQLRVYMDTIRLEAENKHTVVSHLEIRREWDSENEITQQAYLFNLDGSMHVIAKYRNGLQELWRIDGDKPTLLWHLSEEDIRNQKEQAQKASESTPSTENTTPPAEGGTNPPASGGENPPPSDTGGNP